MAEGDNITTLHPVGSPPKDPTAAARARRFRKRRKSQPAVTRRVTPTVTIPAIQTVTPTVTPAEPKTATLDAPVTAENEKQSEAVTPISDERPPTSTVTVITLVAALALAT